MNIYQAILKAANHIERNPGAFNFSSVHIPNGCGTPGCALGWIGHFAGVTHQVYSSICLVAKNPSKGDYAFPVNHLFDIDQTEFYSRMDAAIEDWDWRFDAHKCATALRLYAAKYHAQDKQDDGEAFKRFLATVISPVEVTAAETREAS